MTVLTHRRGQCPHCRQICEQRSTTVPVGGRAVPAWECNECGISYADEPEPADVPAIDEPPRESVPTDYERVESERNQALEAKCALLAASLKQADARAEAAERELAELEAERGEWKRAADEVADKYAKQAEASLIIARGFERKLSELVSDLRLWFNSGVSSKLGTVDIANFEETMRKYGAKL